MAEGVNSHAFHPNRKRMSQLLKVEKQVAGKYFRYFGSEKAERCDELLLVVLDKRNLNA